MHKFILKKLILMIPMILAISFLVFLGMELSPVDPILFIVSPDVSSSPEMLDALRAQYGLDQPFFIRYCNWLGNLLQGDFGYSIVSGTPILTIIAQTLPATFELALTALFFSTIIGILVGVLSAVYQNGIIDNCARFFAVLAVAIPQFFFGILILNLFALKLGWLPVGGRIAIDNPSFTSHLKHLALPSLTLSLALVAALMRYTRNSMLDVFNADYVKTARAKGVPEWKVYVKHIFRNAMRPILVLLIFRFPLLVGGSVIIESVFSWPGIGRVILNSVIAGDFPVIMVTTLIIAIVILFASLLVDITAALLDPRVRHS